MVKHWERAKKNADRPSSNPTPKDKEQATQLVSGKTPSEWQNDIYFISNDVQLTRHCYSKSKL